MLFPPPLKVDPAGLLAVRSELPQYLHWGLDFGYPKATFPCCPYWEFPWNHLGVQQFQKRGYPKNNIHVKNTTNIDHEITHKILLWVPHPMKLVRISLRFPLCDHPLQSWALSGIWTQWYKLESFTKMKQQDFDKHVWVPTSIANCANSDSRAANSSPSSPVNELVQGDCGDIVFGNSPPRVQAKCWSNLSPSPWPFFGVRTGAKPELSWRTGEGYDTGWMESFSGPSGSPSFSFSASPTSSWDFLLGFGAQYFSKKP